MDDTVFGNILSTLSDCKRHEISFETLDRWLSIRYGLKTVGNAGGLIEEFYDSTDEYLYEIKDQQKLLMFMMRWL
ncbi:MAG: hypothetical protein ACHQIM_21895 [Sphingobacteriales bacterium]